MRKRIIHVIVFVVLALLSSAGVGAQTTSARRQLDQAVAIEDPNERIVALKAFISKNSNEQLLASAHEQVVLGWAQLGERQLAANNPAGATDAFRTAVTELPEQVSDTFFQETVARIPFVMSARGYRTEAIELARLLEGRFSKEPLRLGTLGEFYINLEAPGEAIRVLEAAVKRSPEEARLRRPLATAYRMSLRLNDAAKELEQVAAIDAADNRVYGELGNLARARGEYPEAIRLYQSQLRKDESSSVAMKGLALSLLGDGKYDEAGAQIARIRQLKGEAEIDRDLHFQTQMAFYYLARGKADEAADAGARALALEPRYSWGRIAAAEIEMATSQFFEAEKHLLSALPFADFPTLRFTLGKLYLGVEDFDGALDQFGKVISLTSAGKFKTRLGGVLDIEASGINELIARERQASIFVAMSPTSEEQFAMAESLIRFDARLRTGKALPVPSASTSTTTRRTRSVREAPASLETLATSFIEAEGVRRPFRALYAARRLVEASQSLLFAIKLADQILDQAETATEAEGSLPEFPNYDREARLRIVRGRALDIKGWALAQLKRNKEAMTTLAEAVDSFGGFPEAKASIWRLATVREMVGEEEEALTLYLAAYERPAQPGAIDIKRTLIEVLYRKVHGSLDGLDAKIGPAPKVAVANETRAPEAKASEMTPEPAIVDLPNWPGAETALATLQPTAVMKGSRSSSMFLVKATAPRPSTIGRPTTLVEAQPDETVRLATRRMNKKLLVWPSAPVDDGAPFPLTSPSVNAPSVNSPEVVNLIELAEREAPKLAPKRPSARLLRRPQAAATEPAIPPSEVALVVENAAEKEAPVGTTRPRTVTASPPRVTSEDTLTTPGQVNTRSRRVEKP